jgi:hypothetical protein
MIRSSRWTRSSGYRCRFCPTWGIGSVGEVSPTHYGSVPSIWNSRMVTPPGAGPLSLASPRPRSLTQSLASMVVCSSWTLACLVPTLLWNSKPIACTPERFGESVQIRRVTEQRQIIGVLVQPTVFTAMVCPLPDEGSDGPRCASRRGVFTSFFGPLIRGTHGKAPPLCPNVPKWHDKR